MAPPALPPPRVAQSAKPHSGFHEHVRTIVKGETMKRIIIAVAIVLLVVGGLGGIKVLQIKTLVAAGKGFAPPPETVSSAVAREEKWQGTLTAIGSITAVQGVTITPEIAGTVRE